MNASSTKPRCLVLTLYSGENEYADCKRSVAGQEGVEVVHECFEFLGSVEAHETLYRRIIDCREEFDVFLKLDADMVFHTPQSLRNLTDRFLSDPGLDHMQLPVFDVPSHSFLMGFHMFSPRVSWSFPLDPLFPDQQPAYPGHRLFDVVGRERYIDHMPDPSLSQCYYLGLHRGAKVVQRQRQRSSRSAAFQLSYLKRIATNTRFDPQRKKLILHSMFRALLSPQDVGQKRDFDGDTTFGILEKVLAGSFATPVLRQAIFRVLRLLYTRKTSGDGAVRIGQKT
ncbi:MAG: hypothetical protein CMF72_00905 [Mameliella sp.]|nr:hypothetical protein [Mameliella sp.]|tara:strand:+ start:16195 stop:17043 length:849 start_codon:yes stop_codon:yes gene_type:complete